MKNIFLKLHILSDVHLEFSDFTPPETNADVVVLAGDISQGPDGIGWARNNFADKEIIYVPGNHEFYGSDRPEILDKLRREANTHKVHLLDNDMIVIGGVRFLGSTLWTDFRFFGDELKDRSMMAGLNGLNDFRVIREAGGNFSPARSVELHEQSLAWLKGMLDAPFGGKTVVVTHHLPSALSVVERFKDSPLTPCFVSELGYLFGRMDLWIHGHTHDNMDYCAKGTRVICNPRGYVTHRGIENLDFKPDMVVGISKDFNR